VAIPSNYVRIGFELNSRGPSGTRANQIVLNWTPYPLYPGPDFGTPQWIGECAAWARTFWQNHQADLMHTSTQLVGLQISTEFGTSAGPVTATTGNRTGALAPPQMAVIGQWYTGTPGRRGRGRTFWPDALEGDFDEGGILSSGATATFGATMSSMLDDTDNVLLGSDFEGGLNGMHLLHSDGGTPSRIIGVNVNPQAGWLRRRGR
jgi:hypothetical protein